MKPKIPFFINKYVLIVSYSLLLTALAIYSYCLVDLNLTIINNPLWNTFRSSIIQLGYFNRALSWNIYLLLISLLFVFHLLLSKSTINALKLSLIIAGITLFAYPFLSHDLFNYIFDAKIFTFYHQNPYLHKALDYPADEWIRFMHWTHRTYPYGPIFLPLTIIPSFLSFGKFLIDFFLFKLFFAFFYCISVYLLYKKSKKLALFFATNPLIIIECLINNHNDLMSLTFGLASFYFLESNGILSKVFGLLSFGIKYLTLPILIVFNNKRSILASFVAMSLIIGYLCSKQGIQPWYFVSFFIFLPFYKNFFVKTSLISFGLLASYFPYISFGGFNKPEWIGQKNMIIYTTVGVTISIYIILFVKKSLKAFMTK